MELLAMTLVAVLVAVAPPAESTEAQDPADAAEQTRELFDRASTQYETSQYNGAVETYTEAYQRSGAIEDEDLRGSVQAAILFNLARAHYKAYGLDQSDEHLRQTVDLLDKYLAQTADLADQLDAEQLLEQAKAELARLEAAREAEPEAAAAPPPTGADEDPAVDAPRRRGLEIGGYTLIGVGVGAGGLALGGALLAAQAKDEHLAGPTREDRDAATTKGQTANAMILAGSVSAGVLISVGVALAIVGRKRSRMSPTAWVTPTSAGFALGGSF